MNPSERDFTQKARQKNIALFSSVLIIFTAILLTVIFIVHAAPPAYAIHVPSLPKKVVYEYNNNASQAEKATTIAYLTS